jgi:hypothetical protein
MSWGDWGIWYMTRVEEYRAYAAECLRIVQLITDLEHRTRLVEMAQRWRDLAKRAERMRPEGQYLTDVHRTFFRHDAGF